MKRRRVFGYSATVTIVVFVGLALPVLRQIYGPVVALVAYAGVALVAGGLTWSLLSRTSDSETGNTTAHVVTSTTNDQSEATAVDGELETLHEQVETDNE